MIKIIRKCDNYENSTKKYDLSLEGHKVDQETESRIIYYITYIVLLFS